MKGASEADRAECSVFENCGAGFIGVGALGVNLVSLSL